MQIFRKLGGFWHQWALGSKYAVDGSVWQS